MKSMDIPVSKELLDLRLNSYLIFSQNLRLKVATELLQMFMYMGYSSEFQILT